MSEPRTPPPIDAFVHRHVGPRPDDVAHMCGVLGVPSLDALIDAAVPAGIRQAAPLDLGPALGEHEALARLRDLADRNGVAVRIDGGGEVRRPAKSFIGLGYHGTLTPPVILRNILENPGWYTQYTPYQAEIAQGRLEALLNFQTMVVDLTGLEIANASMLDEATAAAEAMTMCHRLHGGEADAFFVADDCHPQTLAVLHTRAEPLGIRLVVGDPDRHAFGADTFGGLIQSPAVDGRLRDVADFADRAHAAGALAVVATDLLALTLLTPPGALGADVAVGSAQRFGVPLGFGGPHAAFMATREAYQRQLPGRLVGVSLDAEGRPGLRLTLQTREQHIRRDRATSNICTAQVLLAVIASMYAVYHGPDGLTHIARQVRRRALALRRVLADLGAAVEDGPIFDTFVAAPAGGDSAGVVRRLLADAAINVRPVGGAAAPTAVGIALDETATDADLAAIARAFGAPADAAAARVAAALAAVDAAGEPWPTALRRTTPFLTHPVFHGARSETEMQRYMRRLEARDLSLTTSMIPLGSCTMKLNAAAEMLPITWPLFGDIHPFAPADQSAGYRALFAELEADLATITGFDAVSLQPNAGSQGEYTGLLVIRAWHRARGDLGRTVCLIPTSAHGTNPASAVMAGLKVVPVACDDQGNIDVADLQAKIDAHADALAALMITYPSTHGVFEATVRDICDRIHAAGGQVYLDGANMNALVGLCRPADFGADVCHLNLHKTFCIPHGGGGPGMGPICVRSHLAPYLPGHPLEAAVGGADATGPVSAAPWSSASILPIPYAYIKMMGGDGLTEATRVAILSANYIAHRLAPHYPIVYTGAGGRVAHECIVDLRGLKPAGIEPEDVAKRLIDYGFHAPTMSWPVAGTLMIEPTESEPLAELDRFCDAMIAIRDEVRRIESGALAAADSPLRHAPHTAAAVTADAWTRPYSRAEAAFPAPWLRAHKFWPPSARIDNVYGDRHIVCTCPPVEAFADSP